MSGPDWPTGGLPHGEHPHDYRGRREWRVHEIRYWPSCENCEGNMGRYSGDADFFMRCEQCGHVQRYTTAEMEAMQPELARTHEARTDRVYELHGANLPPRPPRRPAEIPAPRPLVIPAAGFLAAALLAGSILLSLGALVALARGTWIGMTLDLMMAGLGFYAANFLRRHR